MAAGSPGHTLLARLAAEMSDDDLRVIAAADYGQDTEKHLSALRDLRATLQVESRMPWHPGEVLELMRWSEPGNPEWKPGEVGLRGHRIRAFCCVALLATVWDDGNDSIGEGDTVARLTDSLIELGEDYERLGLAYLDWRLPELERHKWAEAPCYAFVSLLLWLRLSREVDPAAICLRVRRVVAIEDDVRRSEWPGYPPSATPFLTGLTTDMSRKYWLGYAEMLGEVGAGLPGQARVEVQALAARVLDV